MVKARFAPKKNIEKAFIAIFVGCYCSIFLLGLAMDIFPHELPVWIPCRGIAGPESPPGVASPADGPPMMPGLGHLWLIYLVTMVIFHDFP